MTISSREAIMKLEGEKWKPMTRKEVEAAIDAEPCNTHIEHCYSCQAYYEWELDEDRFLSVIWLAICETKPLTPGGSRMIRDVAQRMEGRTFESLELQIQKKGLEWFGPCCKIEENFDYNKFGTIWLRGATDDERDQSKPGKYHILHGAHRSLVLGKLLREGKIEYKPVKAILIKTTGSTPPDKILYRGNENAQIQHYQDKLSYEIDSWDLNRAIQNGERIVVIDTRSPEAFAEEHIPGAVNLPHRNMSKRSTAQYDRTVLYVTYCDGIGCNASTKGALNMAQLGFWVRELIGGLEWWKRDNYPTEK